MNDDFACPMRDSTCNKHKNAPKEKERGKREHTTTGEEEGEGEEGEEKEGPRRRGEGLDDTVGGQGGQRQQRRLGRRKPPKRLALGVL